MKRKLKLSIRLTALRATSSDAFRVILCGVVLRPDIKRIKVGFWRVERRSMVAGVGSALVVLEWLGAEMDAGRLSFEVPGVSSKPQ
jgi:hypothetical protein